MKLLIKSNGKMVFVGMISENDYIRYINNLMNISNFSYIKSPSSLIKELILLL